MKNYYLLWSAGKDQPGIVASITKSLYEMRCNIEDSSMMRLGSEFALFLIFTAPTKLRAAASPALFRNLEKKYKLSGGIKMIRSQDARFIPPRSNFYIVTMHGKDQPGLVYKLTSSLANFRFNITDLSTHRTSSGSTAGYIVMAEGEMPQKNKIPLLQKSLKQLERATHTRIELRPVSSHAL